MCDFDCESRKMGTGVRFFPRRRSTHHIHIRDFLNINILGVYLWSHLLFSYLDCSSTKLPWWCPSCSSDEWGSLRMDVSLETYHTFPSSIHWTHRSLDSNLVDNRLSRIWVEDLLFSFLMCRFFSFSLFFARLWALQRLRFTSWCVVIQSSHRIVSLVPSDRLSRGKMSPAFFLIRCVIFKKRIHRSHLFRCFLDRIPKIGRRMENESIRVSKKWTYKRSARSKAATTSQVVYQTKEIKTKSETQQNIIDKESQRSMKNHKQISLCWNHMEVLQPNENPVRDTCCVPDSRTILGSCPLYLWSDDPSFLLLVFRLYYYLLNLCLFGRPLLFISFYRECL